MLLKVADGGIEKIDYKQKRFRGHWDSDDFERNVIASIDINLTKYTISITFDSEWCEFTEAELVLLLLKNVVAIQQGGESHFCQWLKNKLNKKYKTYVMKPKK